ncbi:MAG: DUF1587 domain-containing protein [Verrucomicrobiales bacterium]|nr:DUF1587 domain-containing protein [Verrucomicrobiales bacterium]
MPALATAAPLPKSVWSFLETHCVECHDEATAEGGLDLYALADEIIAGEVPVWTHVLDRVSHGEMPPSEQMRPSSEEVSGFLSALSPPLVQADLELREVVMRRLNRVEYQHTVRDLLEIETDLISLLPEDQSAGGFDTNGRALAVSAEQFEAWLAAARRALDDAIVHGDAPAKEMTTVDSFREVDPYLGKQYARIDDEVVLFLRNKTDYSKISTRSHRTPVAGRYRFSFSVTARNTEEPLVFSVTASDFKRTGATYRDLGFYEALPESREVVIETYLEAGFAIQFFAHGLPYYLKDPAQGAYPGIGFGPVTIEGPLFEDWPPMSHQQLLGENPNEGPAETEGRALLERFMNRAWRRPVSGEEVEKKLALIEAKRQTGASAIESFRIGLEAVLCSPHFLYFQEGHDEMLADHALAERLSYFLWASLPDEPLRELADRTSKGSTVKNQNFSGHLSAFALDEATRHNCNQPAL